MEIEYLMYAIVYSLYCSSNGTNFNLLALLELEKMLTLINEENFEILIFQKILSSQLQKCGNIVSNVCNRLLYLLRFYGTNFNLLALLEMEKIVTLINEEKFEILIFQKFLSGGLQKCGNILSNVCNR